MKEERNYGIDLLRIISMWMICVLHVLGAGGVLSALPEKGVRYEVAWALEGACYVAVNCYALISGYVGNRSRFRWNRILQLWVQVVFYAAIITFLYIILCPGNVGREQIFVVLTPVLHGRYWYVTAYFILALFMPLLNTGLTALDNGQRIMLVLVILIFSFAGRMACGNVFGLQNGYSVLWLMLLYLLGGCLSYITLSRWQVWGSLALYIAGIGVTCWQKGIAYNYDAPGVLLASVGLTLFLAHIRVGVRAKRAIKLLAPLTFSVYLIHMHPFVADTLLVGKYSWIASSEKSVFWMTVAVMGQAFLIYVVCSLIDLGREWLFRLLRIRECCLYVEKVLNRGMEEMGARVFNKK